MSCKELESELWEYFHKDRQQAENELALALGHSNFTCQSRGSDAFDGPLPYAGGMHYNCYEWDGEPAGGSIVSSPCCNEKNTEDERWGAKYKPIDHW